MPGQGSYGSGGKWIHDRANRIMEDSPETPKNVAYAIATQQGHKVGKSPKGFRTSQGVSDAKAKYELPKSDYQKTAQYAGFFDELQKIGSFAAQDVPEEDKAQANTSFNKSRKVATFGSRKPPDPNIRAVATNIPRPEM
jgi:hypothetical protein